MVLKVPKIDLQLLQLRRPLPSKIPPKKRFEQTPRGLLHWRNWNDEYDVEELNIWKESYPIREIKAIDAALKRAQQVRNSHSPSRAIDAFIVKHHTARLKTHRSMLPFLRLEHEISVIEYCIRTAPPKIISRLGSFNYNLAQASYEFGEEIGHLLDIRLIQSHSFHNPLYFQTLVWKYKANKPRRDLLQTVRGEKKWIRHMGKIQPDRDLSSSTFNLSMRTSGTLRLSRWDHDLVVQRTRELDMDPRRWLTSGFFESMRLFLGFAHTTSKKAFIVTSFECLLTDTNQLRVARLGFKDKFYHILQSNINTAPELHRLNNDLAALRFYALQNIPHYTSLEGMQRGKELLQYMEHSAQSSRMYGHELKAHKLA